ncbi:MAG: hypothetical protein IIA61_00845 [Candidatus Marinimicrobia bacterium]|nr:hypothetical protein [Candidatus Neomarinimicrobiota bacterium]
MKQRGVENQPHLTGTLHCLLDFDFGMSFDIGYETEKAVLGWVFQIILVCLKKDGFCDGFI